MKYQYGKKQNKNPSHVSMYYQIGLFWKKKNLTTL